MTDGHKPMDEQEHERIIESPQAGSAARKVLDRMRETMPPVFKAMPPRHQAAVLLEGIARLMATVTRTPNTPPTIYFSFQRALRIAAIEYAKTCDN